MSREFERRSSERRLPVRVASVQYPPMSDVELTRILRDVAAGRREESDQLLAALYEDLRGLAGRHMRGERIEHTLQASVTELLLEACRLQDEEMRG